MSYYANEEDDAFVRPSSPSSSRRSSKKSSSGISKRRASKRQIMMEEPTYRPPAAVEAGGCDDAEDDDILGNNNTMTDVEEDIVMVGRSGDVEEEEGEDEKDDDEEEDIRTGDRSRSKHRKSSSKSRERKTKTEALKAVSKKRSASRSKKGKSSGRRRSRQQQLYDDIYGTDYHEIDDGIVGCADALCVNADDVFRDEEGRSKNRKKGWFARKSKQNSLLSDHDDKSALAGKTTDPIINTGEPNKAIVDENEEVYVVKQRYGYFSIFFGIIQMIILALMMWQCGIAPWDINPMIGPYPDALSEWGGKNSILIVEDGEWWRLMTPILLHAGVIHLFCNVAVQLELGVFFEREWGSMTWLLIYLSSALGSSVLSVIVMPDAISVGSSGAVMGLFGAKLAEVICRVCEKDDTAQKRVAHQVRKEQCLGVTCSVIVVLAFSFVPYGTFVCVLFISDFCFLIKYLRIYFCSFFPTVVDWAAHLGGLLAGFFVGFMTFSFYLESYCYRLLWFLVGMALTLGFFIPCIDIMYSGEIPMNEELRDVCGYYQQNFDDYECNCMREEYLENMKNGNWNYIYNGKNDDAGGDEQDADNGERFLVQLARYYGL